MPDPYAKVQVGDPLQISAPAWNAVMDATQAFKRNELNLRAPVPASAPNPTIIRVKNESGVVLPRHSVMGLGGPIFTPDDTSEDTFLREICFKGVTPTLSTHRRKYVVTLDPAPINRVVRAVIAGVCQARVDMLDRTHGYANITDGDASHMTSSRHGHARILWYEDITYGYGDGGGGYGYGAYDHTWAIVMLGVTGSSEAVGVAHGDIPPRFGNQPGKGSVDLYVLNGDAESAIVETIDVFNDSAELTTNGNGIDAATRVAVSWDADDTPWVAPLECSNHP